MPEVKARIISICLLWILFFVLAAAGCSKTGFQKKHIKSVWIVMVLLAVFQAVTPIGLDKPNYITLFEGFSYSFKVYASSFQNIANARLEPFFTLEIMALKQICDKYQIFLFINYIIPFYIVYRYILKKEENPMLLFAFFIMMNFFNMDMLRSFFASCIYAAAIYGTPSIKKFIACGCIPLFHLAGAAGIGANFLIRFRSKKAIVFLIAMGITAIFTAAAFKGQILAACMDITLKKEFNLFSKAAYYLLKENFRADFSGFTKFVIITRKRLELSINLAILLWAAKAKCIPKKHQGLYKSAIFGSFLYGFFFALGADTLGSRLSQFLSVGMFLIAGDVIAAEKDSQKRALKYAILLILVLSFNFFVTLEYAGIDNPNSPFYLGRL